MAGETTTATPLRLGVVRIDHTNQAASDWQEGLDMTKKLHRDLGQALEQLGAVVTPLTEGQEPAQAVLDVHHALIECVALFVESMARYEAAAPGADALARS